MRPLHLLLALIIIPSLAFWYISWRNLKRLSRMRKREKRALQAAAIISETDSSFDPDFVRATNTWLWEMVRMMIAQQDMTLLDGVASPGAVQAIKSLVRKWNLTGMPGHPVIVQKMVPPGCYLLHAHKGEMVDSVSVFTITTMVVTDMQWQNRPLPMKCGWVFTKPSESVGGGWRLQSVHVGNYDEWAPEEDITTPGDLPSGEMRAQQISEQASAITLPQLPRIAEWTTGEGVARHQLLDASLIDARLNPDLVSAFCAGLVDVWLTAMEDKSPALLEGVCEPQAVTTLLGQRFTVLPHTLAVDTRFQRFDTHTGMLTVELALQGDIYRKNIVGIMENPTRRKPLLLELTLERLPLDCASGVGEVEYPWRVVDARWGKIE